MVFWVRYNSLPLRDEDLNIFTNKIQYYDAYVIQATVSKLSEMAVICLHHLQEASHSL